MKFFILEFLDSATGNTVVASLRFMFLPEKFRREILIRLRMIVQSSFIRKQVDWESKIVFGWNQARPNLLGRFELVNQGSLWVLIPEVLLARRAFWVHRLTRSFWILRAQKVLYCKGEKTYDLPQKLILPSLKLSSLGIDHSFEHVILKLCHGLFQTVSLGRNKNRRLARGRLVQVRLVLKRLEGKTPVRRLILRGLLAAIAIAYLGLS